MSTTEIVIVPVAGGFIITISILLLSQSLNFKKHIRNQNSDKYNIFPPIIIKSLQQVYINNLIKFFYVLFSEILLIELAIYIMSILLFFIPSININEFIFSLLSAFILLIYTVIATLIRFWKGIDIRHKRIGKYKLEKERKYFQKDQ